MFKVAWTALTDMSRERGGMKKQADRDKFVGKLDYLFSITSCTHKIIPCSEDVSCDGCEIGAHLQDCNCHKEKRIPRLELKFMMIMQAYRPAGQKASMMISGPDKVESARQEKALRRKEKYEERVRKRRQKEMCEETDMRNRELEEQELELEENVGEPAPSIESKRENISKRNTVPLTQTALAAVR